MEKTSVNVRMLGEFVLNCGEAVISDRSDRSSKTWLLLAYMIYSRGRNISQEAVVSLIWGDYDTNSDPANALKTIVHRTRSTIDELGPGMGKKLLARRQGNYFVSDSIHITTDVDEFEALCRNADNVADEDMKLNCLQKALELYKGKFLSKLSNEMWVVPLITYYHNLYIRALSEALDIMDRRNMYPEIETVCRKAIEIDPNEEMPYSYLMRAYIEMGSQHSAVTVYNSLSSMLYTQLGVIPSDEVRSLYREAVKTKNENTLELEELQEQLSGAEDLPGAYMCEYDFFKVIYRVEARSISRTGIAVHIGLLSVENASSGRLSKRSLEICMDNLDDVIRTALRQGDIASRCSISQYVILLPKANYENSVMIMDRIVKSFNRKFPHSPAKLGFTVYPLRPVT